MVGPSQQLKIIIKSSCLEGKNRSEKLIFDTENAILRGRWPGGGKTFSLTAAILGSKTAL